MRTGKRSSKVKRVIITDYFYVDYNGLLFGNAGGQANVYVNERASAIIE
jgi:hypothetical protein